MDKRILILANAALSQSDSNGRSMAMMLSQYRPEQLAQLYTYGTPDYSLCRNYYRVTDKEALSSFLHRKPCGGIQIENSEESTSYYSNIKKRKRTPLNMLIREFVWKYGCWRNAQFGDWVNKFSPDSILISLADNIFMIDLAIDLSKTYHIPVIAVSTEEYVFKKYNYLTKRKSLLYWVFHCRLSKAYKRISKYVEKGYFNSPLLKDAYAKRYGFPCYVAMPQSSIDWQNNTEINEPVTVSYLGNLGINRHLPLIEIANAIAVVCPGVCLDIYGKIPNDEVGDSFKNCNNICYKGFVDYNEVRRIIHKSTLVVHAESQQPFYVRDLRYALSTKIADSICSGTPLLIYGDSTMAAMDMITKEKCAFTCTNSDTLIDVVRQALTDVTARQSVLNEARRVRETLLCNSERAKI